jgi:hypothetical protein
MTWGWSGCNTRQSLELLAGPTTADRTTELGTLSAMAGVLVGKDNTLRSGAEHYVAQERLSDYKSIAD